MPICQGCGSSYEESFRFCPYCGRSKPTETSVIVANTIRCKSCGHLNSSSLIYCQNCGKSIIIKCRQCNFKNPISVEYCGNCGIKLNDARISFSTEETNDWKNKFCKHPGNWNYYMSNNYYETTILPVAQKIADNLKDPLPQKLKRDFVFLVPIIKYDWCITSVAYNNHEIVYGIVEIYSNLLCLYNFQKQSRTYLYYEDLVSTNQNGDYLYLNFNDRKLTLHFQIPEPSDFAAKATSALGFAGSLLSEILFDKSNLDRQLESIEQRLKNLDPNRLSPSDQAHYEYLREKEAAETLLPLYISFFKDIIQKKLNF